jgi:subtilase family serine protease
MACGAFAVALSRKGARARPPILGDFPYARLRAPDARPPWPFPARLSPTEVARGERPSTITTRGYTIMFNIRRLSLTPMTILVGLPLTCALLSLSARAASFSPQAVDLRSIVATQTAARVGSPPADQVMHLVVSLPLRNSKELDVLLSAIYDPASPQYRRFLSVAEFTDRFGPAEADYDKAVAFFEQRGFVVGPRAANRYLMALDAKVSDVERVFHVTMGLYRHPTEDRNFLSPDRSPTFDLDTPLQEVLGLDNFELPHNKMAQSPVPSSAGGSGPNGQFIGSDIRAAYYPSGNLTGVGQSVGLMELEGVNLSDVALFFANNYGAANSVDIKLIATDSEPVTCTGRCSDGEQALDIEYTISMAPGLNSVRVYIGSSPEDVLNAMASDNISKVLSTSWGWRENTTDNGLFAEFAAQGQTNLTASGDDSTLTASGPWPEEARNIIGVGGTDLHTASPGGPWSNETGWKDSAGGPSVNPNIPIESYQLPYITAQNGGSTTLRNVPDIAASADTDMEICADGRCSGGSGGTSFASPIWAGFIALANEEASIQGKPVVGFINPRIYALGHEAGDSNWFHDITVGESGIFSCEPSYDLVTGLGSPQGQALILRLIE